ncbi:MAG: glycine dehydrogenase, partial [Candidatus Zixiibacteriota bacterium]
MSFIPNTDDDRRRMLEAVGAASFDELISVIPEELRLKRPLDIEGLSEMEVLAEIRRLAEKNHRVDACFAGGGVYDHFVPAAVQAIISRPEFLTAYTPYQPEVAQGTLQVTYEYQTHICRLTGMDVANASMYDGASAAAEAVALAVNVTRRNRVLVAEALNPMFRNVIKTYHSGRDVELVSIPMQNGLTDLSQLES